MDVYDIGEPSQVTVCSGTIFIQRNIDGPIFPRNFEVEISEYHEMLTIVENITATDKNDVSFSIDEKLGESSRSVSRALDFCV